MTPLQKHVSFFDRNKDGVIYPKETYEGFRAIGFGVALSSVSSVLIHGFLSPKTNNGTIPAILLPILVANIQKGKHGSDTGAYDTEGRLFVALHYVLLNDLEEPVSYMQSDPDGLTRLCIVKHAHTNPNALTSDELKEMLKANQQPNNTQGWVASRTEWEILFSLAKDKDGMLQKDTVRLVYDGSLFYKLEAERKALNESVNVRVEERILFKSVNFLREMLF
ncbi:probable peroxygenase 4 [Phoenix dactylifera]|uniref:Probable peroxygenase 4 n=1 Tax=Phoenix dactylifera TaxID=42345 RepID=A0A8B8ZT23_PHODC|nr:probable peroxygenase 4 [Phoenix dactylifera]